MSALPMMAAHVGGSFTPSRRMLPIRQNLNQLAGINRTYKAVLIEVCELVENGTAGTCNASNEYLAERLQASPRTISRTLAGLEALGLLDVSGATNKREMLPSPQLRACYAGTDMPAAIRFVSQALTIDKTAPTIDKTDRMAIATLSETIDNQGTNYGQLGSNYSQVGSRVYRDDHTTKNDQTVEVEALRSALAAASKKNEELSAKLETVTHQRDQLRNSLNAVRPGGATASASHTRGAARRPFADSKFATLEGFRELASQCNCSTACAEYYLPDMKVKALGEEDRDEAGWRNYVHAWLKRERDSDAGLVTKMPVAGGKPGKVGQVDKRRSAIEAAMALDDEEENQ
ncbi:helix-turn-helix domain-containing protein [Hymenobacter sp. BT635]|uniref:Helix-turn-helix domain-containing protein n=1 Tax=Hymenobacter nitidus TaxID=2880929 RepID=A0ABS8AHB4_9BACT|nr:helix-turn-helix domain-containing protein [Hymenobacter nitidus]MCB2379828.1 helix-turn-helix domain-containing protein [Hymenobacter nitidus]